MTRTAISPRLAMRTFFSTLRLSPSPATGRQGGPHCVPSHTVTTRMVPAMSAGGFHFDVQRPVRRHRVDQLATCWRRPAGRPRGRGGRGRPPDGRPGPAGPAVGGAARGRPAGLGAAAPGPRRRPAAPVRGGRGPGRWPTPAPAGGRGRTPPSSGPTTCWSGGGSWPGCWPRPTPRPRRTPGVGGRGRGRRRQRGLAGGRRGPAARRAGGRRTSLGAGRRPVDREALLGAPARRPSGRPAGALGDARGPAPAWRTSCAGRTDDPGTVGAGGAGRGAPLDGDGRRPHPRGPPRGETAGDRPTVAAGDVVHVRPDRADGRAPGRQVRSRVRSGSAVQRLLVTGGAGFIGSNFVRYWVEQHPDDPSWPTTCSPTPGTAPTWPTWRTGSPSSRATSATWRR